MASTTVGFRTDTGRLRAFNEDRMLVGNRVWAVADGMGGHAAGDVAAALVIRRLTEFDAMPVVRPADVAAVVIRANEDVLAHAQRHPEAWGMGSTVTGLVECLVGGEPHWAIFNVGDSRVYRFTGHRLRRATIDHSETQELIDRGLLTPAEAGTHALRHVITRSVGTRPPPLVDVWVVPCSPGQRFLLCSDGLTSELSDEQIEAMLAATDDPMFACEALVAAVLRTAARDNVSVIVVDVAGSELVDTPTNPRGHLLEKEPA